MAGTRDGAIEAAAQRFARANGDHPGNYFAHVQAGEKRCTRCHQWRLTADFGRDRSRGDGRAAVCTPCRTTRIAPGPGKPERRLKRTEGLAWCRACAAWLPATDVRAGLCSPHINEDARNRYASDERVRAERKAHRDRRRRGIEPVPAEARQMILEDFDGRCAYCAAPAETWDHIVAVSKGGTTNPGNVVPACICCNSSKGAQDIEDWLDKRGQPEASDVFMDRYSLAFCGLTY